MAPISIVHVINGGIGVGGAERMLVRVVQATDRARFRHTVVSILPCDYLASTLHAIGVPFTSLNVDVSARLLPRLLGTAPKLFNLPRADLLVGWLNYGNVLASTLGALRRGVPVVLNFRGTYSEADLRRPVMRVMRALAPRAARRLANSSAAIKTLEDAGFGTVDFVPNGFSPEEFQRLPVRGAEFRAQHGIPLDSFLFGHVGRFHPMKNQSGLLRAAERVLNTDARVHVALVGRDLATALARHVPAGELSRRVHLIEGVDHPQDAYSALDAYVHSSSWGEGFPNVIAEAMLHSLPIICTDVAESRAIVGPGNWVVPPQREDLLATAMVELLLRSDEARAALGTSNRARIASLYSVERSVNEFERHFSCATGGH